MKTLFYDTETTGKWNFKSNYFDPRQPRLVQIGAVLMDDDREIACLGAIIKPEGFEIPTEASDIHGITTQIALRDGVERATALEMFSQMAYQATLSVCHNSDFDRRIIEREYFVSEFACPLGEHFCTMQASTDLCQIPGPYGLKWPKLSEVFEFAFGEKMEGAHNAMADIRATIKVYNWIVSRPKL